MATGRGWNDSEYTNPRTDLMGCKAVSAHWYIEVKSVVDRPCVSVVKRARFPGGLVVASSIVKSVRADVRRVFEICGCMEVKGLNVAG